MHVSQLSRFRHLRDGGNGSAIGRNCDITCPRERQFTDLLARCYIPPFDHARVGVEIVADRDQRFAIRREERAADRSLIIRDVPYFLSRGRVPDTNLVIPSARGNGSAVWREIQIKGPATRMPRPTAKFLA